MWANLSQNGNRAETIVLPGNMTGRQCDRYFKCVLLGSAPSVEEKETWADYIFEAVDHVDFIEIKAEEWNKDGTS
jgi:hypothetical protein